MATRYGLACFATYGYIVTPRCQWLRRCAAKGLVPDPDVLNRGRCIPSGEISDERVLRPGNPHAAVMAYTCIASPTTRSQSPRTNGDISRCRKGLSGIPTDAHNFTHFQVR